MFLRHSKFSLVLALLLAIQAGSSFAERADRDKPMNIESDQMSLDNGKHVSIFEGNVVLTQGTLRVLAEKVVVTEDDAGNKFSVATGHLASFRQKRDGADEYVEGYGERIEYNSLSGQVDFYVHARVKRDQDDVRGDHITYSTKTEIFSVNSPEQTGRVRATLQPKSKQDNKHSEAAGTAKASDVVPAGESSSAVAARKPPQAATLPKSNIQP